MEPIDYRGALARGWRLLVVLGIVGLVAGLLLAPSGKSSRWVSYSTVGALPASATTSGPLTPGLSTDQILFYAASDQVIADAGRGAQVNQPVSVLRSMITVTGPGATSSGTNTGQPGVVQVQVKAPTEAESASLNNNFDLALYIGIARATAAQLRAQETDVQKSIAVAQYQLSGLTDRSGATAAVLESELNALETRQSQLAATSTYTGFTTLASANGAVKSSPPLSDSRAVRGLFGLLIGVLLGAVVALAASMLDKRLRSSRVAEAAFGYPVVSEIPAPSVPSTEAYRMLWLSVFREPLARPVVADERWADLADLRYDRLDLAPEVAPSNQGPRPRPVPSVAEPSSPVGRQVVLVASPGTEPTRASVAASLANACVGAGQRVAVISTGHVLAEEHGAGMDHDRPDHRAIPISTRDVEAMLEDTRVAGVYALPLRRLVARPGQLVAVAPAVFDALRTLVDVVIVEVPPFLTVHHGEGLVPMVDVVLVVGEYRFTTSDEVRRTGAVLRRLEAPVAGLALTNVPASAGDHRAQSGTATAVDDVEPVADAAGPDRVDDAMAMPPRQSGGAASGPPPNPGLPPTDADDPDFRGH